MSEFICRSEIGAFKVHSYEGTESCIRCGEAKPGANKVNGQQQTAGGIAHESLGDIKRTEQGARYWANGSPVAKKSPRRKQASEKPDRARDLALEAETRARRERAARFLARLPHQAQGMAAKYVYGYQGNAFDLTRTELDSLCKAWVDVAEQMNWQLDSQWMVIGTLLFLEAEISMRQWAQAEREMMEEHQRQQGAVQ